MALMAIYAATVEDGASNERESRAGGGNPAGDFPPPETKGELDRDLAALYGVPTKVLKQAVKRNAGRFPEDFMFVLTREEFANGGYNL